ncbi:TrmH family RNA methyltransferase [Paenibacillus sp. WLX1005]|uniref:TrmH family RNA methyltransferase n=1 Tax=Paenibacillus sp. WLX1005 TaxID=3243766 RepID=UPI0039845D6E
MEILSTQNARVKEWAQLLEKKHRDKQEKFIIEGIHLVSEALRSDWDIQYIVYDTDKGIPAELREDISTYSGGAQYVAVSQAVLEKCTDTKTPQPVFAIVYKRNALLSTLLTDEQGIVMVLDGVQDPGNVGTIIRSADASGAKGIVLGKGCADLYNPKTIRSTMGSLFHLPVLESDLTEVLPAARKQGARLISTSLQGSTSCYEYDFHSGAWIVIGNEGKGISEQTAALVEEHVLIPMQGQAESLNAAMASTVLLFEAMRQRGFN